VLTPFAELWRMAQAICASKRNISQGLGKNHHARCGLGFGGTQRHSRVKNGLDGLRMPSCGSVIRGHLHRFEFGRYPSQAITCRTHSASFPESLLLNLVAHKPISDPTVAKRRTRVDKSTPAFMRKGFGRSLADRLAFPLGYDAEHVDDEATGGGLRIEGFTHLKRARR